MGRLIVGRLIVGRLSVGRLIVGRVNGYHIIYVKSEKSLRIYLLSTDEDTNYRH